MGDYGYHDAGDCLVGHASMVDACPLYIHLPNGFPYGSTVQSGRSQSAGTRERGVCGYGLYVFRKNSPLGRT